MFALVDCNNFYASCERLFRPDMQGKPVVVLSSGDGCVIARSNEAKILGIQMGEPYFKIKPFCQKNQVHFFSSNFALYRDMSQRVMSVIEDSWDSVEIYSVDEAFLDLSRMSHAMRGPFCMALQKKIFKYTGIPTSIGLGRSKTLCKLSNHLAKKTWKVPVVDITEHMDWLKKIDIGDVWGIGKAWRQRLMSEGICTAYDLTQRDLNQLKKQYSIVMMRTAMELQGTPCFHLDSMEEKRKSILSSRSFHGMQTDFDGIAQAVSMHCDSVYEKLRAQGSLAYNVCVFLRTNRFRDDLPQYEQSASIRLVIPTDDVRLITHHAKQSLRDIFKSGFQYKKVGVMLTELVDNTSYQFDLFHDNSAMAGRKTKAFLDVFDAVNQQFGKHALRLAAVGFDKSWDTQFQFRSPAYTTRWQDLMKVKNRT